MLRIDSPADSLIDKPVCSIRGWFAAKPREGAGRIRIEIEGAPAPWFRIARPDVCAHYPGLVVVGFQIAVDLSYYMQAVRNRRLAITVTPETEPPIRLEFTIHKDVVPKCLAAASG